MATRILAHFSDAHLGQKLLRDGDVTGEKMAYAHEPGEHIDRLRIVLDDIKRKGISDVVFGGDIGGPGTAPSFFGLLAEYAFNLSIVLGNHDAYRVVAPFCGGQSSAVEGKMCRADARAPWKIIRLDSSENRLGDEQMDWLSRELDGTRRAALFLHHPILDIDTPVERSGVALRDRDQVKRLLRSSLCEISIFCGHFHMVDETVVGNLRQFVTPAVSYQIIKNADRVRTDAAMFGYRTIEFGDDVIKSDVTLFEASQRDITPARS